MSRSRTLAVATLSRFGLDREGFWLAVAVCAGTALSAAMFQATRAGSPLAWMLDWTIEDHAIENAEAVYYLGGALICLYAALRGVRTPLVFMWLIACFVAGGEEISWGQRILGFDVASVEAVNVQGEFNLHNLAVLSGGGLTSSGSLSSALKALMTSQNIFQMAFVAFFLILPPASRLIPNSLLDRLGYVLPPMRFLIALWPLVILAYALGARVETEALKDALVEVRELFFAAAFLMYAIQLLLLTPRFHSRFMLARRRSSFVSTEEFTMRVFTDWAARHGVVYGHQPMRVHHDLHRSELFTDEGLAHLIEAAPRQCYNVTTMDRSSHNPRSWRDGDLGKHTGSAVLEAVKRGAIWINLQRLETFEGRFASMLKDIFSDLENGVPGLKTYNQKLGLLISSPNVQVYYHCDIPGQGLWQLRGRKRVYVYPNTEPFLKQEQLERVILNEVDEIGLDYEPWYDEHAAIMDLEPGDMVTWPINAPHRVVNADEINVSITTEHWTDDLRDRYAVYYGNRLLRRTLGWQKLRTETRGVPFWLKFGLAGLHKRTALHRKSKRTFQVDFEVDPHASQGIRNIQAYQLAK